MKRFLLIAAAVSASPCFAQSGADILLDRLGDKSAAPTAAAVAPKLHSSRVNLDSFQSQLANQVDGSRNLGFNVMQWVQLILDGQFGKAAHLWTAIQPDIPADFSHQARATQLYLLAKLGLNQTLFDQWLTALADESYAKSAPELALETILTPGLDARLLQSPVIVHLKAQVARPFYQTLKAWSELRDEHKAQANLAALPAHSALNRWLANIDVYNRARTGDLKGAAKVLKQVIEPEIDAAKDLNLLAAYNATIARILYQAGQVQAAGEFYRKIPNQVPNYLAAREELAWVYLRLNDMSKLRGELAAFASPVFKDRFQPEVYLLRAISDLKMCFYEKVEKDIGEFSKSNLVWAKKIEQALAAATPPAPAVLDEHTELSLKTLQNIEAENQRMNKLGGESIGAVLPAVGWQQHWKDYLARSASTLEEARKRLSDDYTRQWKNQRSILQEAVKKMRFVKVEYLSQVRQLGLAEAGTQPGTKVASLSDSIPAKEIAKGNEEKLIFPVVGDLWPDELFRLRSAAQARCLKKAGSR